MSNNAKLSDHIKVLSEFQYSINIEYDLYSDVKIQNYIPTTSAIDIIEDIMLSTWPKSAERSRIFVGAYGKGKSHLALMLIALLCRKKEKLYKSFLDMVQETKPELSRYIAQNERTLFTFLSSDGQKHTLTEFIKKFSSAMFPLLTPDFIYDYFEPLFKAEAYDRPIHKLWKTASVALNRIEHQDLLGAKIIKTIALIYILDRVDILSPDIDISQMMRVFSLWKKL